MLNGPGRTRGTLIQLMEVRQRLEKGIELRLEKKVGVNQVSKGRGRRRRAVLHREGIV